MTGDKRNNIPPCPTCHGERVEARLKAPGIGNFIYIHELEEESNDLQTVHAWWCEHCGSVELHTGCVPNDPGKTTTIDRGL